MALNPKKVVGLDVGSSVVKAVQLRKSGRGFELERFGVAEIYRSGEKRAGAQERRDAKVEAIRKALSEAGISAKFSISAVAGESIIVRYIQLPDMPEDELKGAIRWEAEDYIPFPLEEVNLDSMILGRSETSGSPKVDVLLVAAKKELVAEHIDLLKAADLQPSVLDVDSFAFLNAFEQNYLPSANEVIALLSIGAEITSINIYIGGVSRFSRDIPIAGDQVTTSIQQRMACTPVKAEELKRKEGAPVVVGEGGDTDQIGEGSILDTIRGTVEKITGEDLADDSPETVVANAIKGTLGSLCSEIKRSIQFFENQPNGKQVERVAIGGGTAMMKNLPQFFSQELGLPVELVDPLRTVTFAGNDKDKARLDQVRHHLGVAVGLGLRAFD